MSLLDFLRELDDHEPVVYPNAIPADQVPLMPLANRPFLVRVVEAMAAAGHGLLAGPVGCGKTRAGAELVARFGFRRLLIVCSTRAFHKWKEVLVDLYPNDLPEIHVMDSMAPKKRAAVWDAMRAKDAIPRVVICSYGLVRQDKAPMTDVRWSMLLADESQAIANPQSRTFKSLRTICHRVAHNRNFFFSGTEMAKGGHDLWTHFCLMAPASFGSYYKFLDAFFVQNNTQYGTQIIGLKKSEAARFRAIRDKFVHKISLAETRGYIPRVQAIVEKVDMGKATQKIYDGLLNQKYYKFADEILIAPNEVSVRLRLRQLVCCPKLVHPSLDYGAGIEFAASHAKSIGRQHIGILTDFPEAMEHFEHFLREKYNYKWVYKLRGGCTPAEVSTIPQQFAQHEGADEPSAILLSIPFCDAFDLPTVHNGYVIGPTWSTVTDTQSKGRFARGNKPYINIYYLLNNNSVEEEVRAVLDINARQIRTVYKQGKD